jgi:hypothetical protein
MITARRAVRHVERALAFCARHAAYSMPADGKAPLMTCRAQAPWKPHDEFDESPQTLLYYVSDGSKVVGSSRLIGYDPQLGLQEQRRRPTVDSWQRKANFRQSTAGRRLTATGRARSVRLPSNAGTKASPGGLT